MRGEGGVVILPRNNEASWESLDRYPLKSDSMPDAVESAYGSEATGDFRWTGGPKALSLEIVKSGSANSLI